MRLISVHRDQLDKIIQEYGFPTKEMVGEDYAMSAIQLVIGQGPRAYMDKHKAGFVKEFGQKLFDTFYNQPHKQ